MILQRRVKYIYATELSGKKRLDKIEYTWWLLGIIPLVCIQEDYDVALRKGAHNG